MRGPGHFNLTPTVDSSLKAIAFFGAMAILPFLGFNSYILGQATIFLIWAAVATQWNLVIGVAGILSIGQMALFSAGGYAVALCGLYLGLSPWATLPLAGLAGFVVSLVMGLATLRLRGPYVVVVTLAIAVAMYQIIVTDVECFRRTATVCYSFTGGARGLSRYGDFGFAALVGYANVGAGNYLLCLVNLAIGTICAIAIVNSPYGRAFQAMRDNEICAACRGIDVSKYQLIIFALSGLLTGVTGGVYAGVLKTFGPQVLELPVLLFVLTMIVIGGRGTIAGPIIGAIVVAIGDESLRGIAEWRNTGFAIALAATLMLAPDGLSGRLTSLLRLARTRSTTVKPAPSLTKGACP
jgi:branched-chain amino acid transport system permease protein